MAINTSLETFKFTRPMAVGMLAGGAATAIGWVAALKHDAALPHTKTADADAPELPKAVAATLVGGLALAGAELALRKPGVAKDVVIGAKLGLVTGMPVGVLGAMLLVPRSH